MTSAKSLLKRSVQFTLALLVSFAAFLVFAVLAARLDSPSDLPQVDNKQGLLIDSVSIVDVATGTVVPDQQLLIRHGLIEDIRAANSTAPSNYQLIDGKGAFVVPGLIDMHTHIYDRKDLVTSLAYGVTSVRNLRGLPMHLRWREELQSNTWLGANLYTSSPVLDRPEHAHLMQQAVSDPQHARELVRQFHADGYDLLKIYNDIEPDILSAIIDEALIQHMPIAKHGPFGAVPASGKEFNLGDIQSMQSLEHVEEIFQTVLRFNYDTEALQRYIQKLKQTGSFVTPTLATFDHLTQLSAHKQAYVKAQPIHRINPFFRFLNEQFAIQRWLQADQAQIDWNFKERNILFKITQQLAINSVPLLVGSDQGTMYMTAGISTHLEMALMQEAGIDPATILRSATLNAATAMHMEQTTGSVARNKIADLALVTANPLTDITHLTKPMAVVKQGQWLGESALAELIASGAQPSHWYPSFGRFIEDIVTRSYL
ncbi:amidohydrolase family protein [Arenicella xantha]|uniref:Amidohydrolase family protein n=1 Tax=Arenicella xantha TaxID=644221 RepID=A0A395JRE7_9GAMM|nr:amidohydrolase family protein [Arenicella xantha]RBP53135.1 amidohydrolase family protein [Arenicella xantha]